MNGWDIGFGAATAGEVGVIHHPRSLPKEIAVDRGPVQACARGWKVVDYELGGTRNGSSGAPLFSDQGRIVGQLKGGGDCWCDGTDCNDVFGGLLYSWFGGLISATSLSGWLAPSASPVYLPGKDCYGRHIGGRAARYAGTYLKTSQDAVEVDLFSQIGAFSPTEDLDEMQILWSAETATGETVAVLDHGWIGSGQTESARTRLVSVEPGTSNCGDVVFLSAAFNGESVGGDHVVRVEYVRGRIEQTDIAPVAFQPAVDDSTLVDWAISDESSATWTPTGSQLGVLTSAPVSLTEATAFIAFEHIASTEGFYDGAAVEYRLDDGEWTDAATLFVQGGYNTRISPLVSSQLSGRDVWSGRSSDWRRVILTLESLAKDAETISLRWIAATDDDLDALSSWIVRNPVVFQTEAQCGT